MTWPRLDTRSWNLALGVAAMTSTVLSACGPTVSGDTDTDTDAGSVTDPSPTDTTAGTPCTVTSDCPAGYGCFDDVCRPEEECNSGGEDCCYGIECDYVPPCMSNEDCGPLEMCVQDDGYVSECASVYELPECAGAPETVALDLPPLGEGQVVSLSFVDVDGDSASDLVVGRENSAELHRGADAAAPVLLPVPAGASVADAASGDLDADGDVDLVLSTLQGDLMTLFGDGAGGFTLAQQSPPFDVPVDLTLLQWDGDGMLDLAYADGQARVRLNDGVGGFVEDIATLDLRECISLAPLDYGSGPQSDLVGQHRVASAYLYLVGSAGDAMHDAFLTGLPLGMRRLLAGRIDAQAPDEVIGYTPLDGRLLVELWAGAGGVPQRFSLTGDETLAAIGDYDGDGVDDLVTAGASSISYVQGGIDQASLPTLVCRSSSSPVPTSTLAVGDFDGNGRADVAVDDGSNPVVLLTQ
jgi:hypothetical protein